MKKSGLAFHCHHNTLIEYCYDYDERVRFIKENKPPAEQELRLKLFRLIPHDKLPPTGLEAYYKARDACDKARDAYYKAWDAYSKAWETYSKARDAWSKAWDAWDKARDAWDKAWDAWNKANHQELEKLHSELCPDCPWDGKTIFSKTSS